MNLLDDALDGQTGEPEKKATRALPIYQVPNPCEESWGGMRVVSEGRRFCGLCAKDVHDLTHLSPEEMDEWVEAWRAERGDEAACVRFYARADGTFVEGDCGPWRERVARQARRAALWSAAKLAAATATLLAFVGISAKFGALDQCSVVTAGELAYVPPEPLAGQMVVHEPPHEADIVIPTEPVEPNLRPHVQAPEPEEVEVEVTPRGPASVSAA